VPQASVIVPIFNGIEFLPRFFSSLQEALPPGSQLILIDDGSTEPVWDTVPEFPAAESVRRLRNKTNLGYSVVANQAFAEATGEIVVQLNTDLILEPECITAMVDLIGRENRVGLVGSKLIYPTTGLTQHVGMAFGNYTKLHFFYELPADHPLSSRTRELQATTGATVAMTRRVLNLLGPLDEAYYNHNEDIEHCLLAAERGLRNFICADSVAYHWKSRSGPARFAGVIPAEAMFWSRWGNRCRKDLAPLVDEALDYAFGQLPELEDCRPTVIDLSRGADQPLVLERLEMRWPGLSERVHAARQMANADARLWLPMLVPHHFETATMRFVYLVDRYRELEENRLWFANREALVGEELIIDLSGAAVPTGELLGR
jgi:GT2 family glycosyltransferase